MDDTLKQKINILIHLACIDGDFDIKEKAFIYNLCLRHGVDLDLIGDMIESPEPIVTLSNLNMEKRVDYLTECMLLMLVDGKVLPKEVNFCLEIGENLGFERPSIEGIINETRDHLNISYESLKERIVKSTHSNA